MGASWCSSSVTSGIWPGPEGRRYLDALSRQAKGARIPIWFIDGNHEDFDQLDALPLDEQGRRPVRDHITHLPRGYRWEWELGPSSPAEALARSTSLIASPGGAGGLRRRLPTKTSPAAARAGGWTSFSPTTFRRRFP